MLEEKLLSKRIKYNYSQNILQEALVDFNNSVSGTLQSISNKLDDLSSTWSNLESKFDDLTEEICKKNNLINSSVLYNEELKQSIHTSPSPAKVTYLTLNKEEDYPEGSWLGDERNPEFRVRCHLLPTEMFFIHSTCTTAEKMALTLLDYLFDRETLAASNISGAGKHKKKQLNPLYIYGIKCHLMFHYGITENDWNKIKQNLDSKCRTAFRRKMKGLSLTSKGKSSYHKKCYKTEEEKNTDSVSLSRSFTEVSNENNLNFQEMCSIPEVHILSTTIREAKPEYPMLHVTVDQINEIKRVQELKKSGIHSD